MRPHHEHTDEPGIDCACDACDEGAPNGFVPLDFAEDEYRRGCREERAKVVAWLRRWISTIPTEAAPSMASAVALAHAADVIEQGKHHDG